MVKWDEPKKDSLRTWAIAQNFYFRSRATEFEIDPGRVIILVDFLEPMSCISDGL